MEAHYRIFITVGCQWAAAVSGGGHCPAQCTMETSLLSDFILEHQIHADLLVYVSLHMTKTSYLRMYELQGVMPEPSVSL